MKASLRWIGEFVDLPTQDPASLAEAMSNLGIEVEGWEEVGPDFSGVVVARTLAIEPHPRADRVRLATLDTGGGAVRVVCGAWNFDEGDIVPYAQVGSRLGDLEVGEKEIRGVVSPGMIASEAELGLGEESGGILVLDEGEPGTDFAGTLPYPDVVFDLSITPNRPDAMSMYGIARDLAALYDVDLLRPDPPVVESGPATAAKVRIEAPEACHRFTAREMRGITVAPSPLWMRLRLRDVGVRPISNVVDISNYVMLEYGQPLHAFDLDRIPEETIVVRHARPDERLTTLDGVDRRLSPQDLIISGPDEALGLAGVMGGESSEVSEATRRVLIEVAHFDPPGILLSGKRHALRSEAVSRFERGVDPELPPVASNRAAQLMAELAGAEAAPGFIDEYPTRRDPVQVRLPMGEAERLLGLAFDSATSADYLQRLGFGVVGDEELRVTVPSFRPDVSRPADLVEEIARLHGYDRIPSRLPFGAGGEVPAWLARERRIRELMAGAGLHEVWSFDFMDMDDLEALDLPAGDPRRAAVELRNPLSEEQSHLRTTLLPGLLRGVATNQARNIADVALFEMGTVFLASDGDLPEQPSHLGFVASGRVAPDDIGDERERDARDASGLAEMLSRALRSRLELEQGEAPGFHPGRAALVLADGIEVGVVGEIHPAVAERFGISGRVAAGELAVDALVSREWQFEAPSPFPPVVFDLAFDLDESVPGRSLVTVVSEAAGPLLERVSVFDVFRGPPLGEGRKSIALRMMFRHPERTLVEDELAETRRRITDEVSRSLGGLLRGG